MLGYLPPGRLAPRYRFPLIESRLCQHLNATREHNPMPLRMTTINAEIVAPRQDRRTF